LVGLSKNIRHVKAVGTDGERNIIDAAKQQFNEALMLCCLRHLQTNIERYLHSKQYSAAAIRRFVQEIFG
jgi:hypothetical protein